MRSDDPGPHPDGSGHPLLVPFSLTVDPIGAMLNAELAEHPVYDGVELQWFDDEAHGTGMLVFLSRRADRSVDYYPQRGLRLDRGGYAIGGGIRSWTETDLDVARLVVADDGVEAEVRFTDVDGRVVEIRVDDRDTRPRRRAGLLAPVSAGTAHPTGLLLVWLPAFDLVRATTPHPTIRIDGTPAAVGRLPGARLHRRRLVKYAAPVCPVELNRNHEGPVPILGDGHVAEHGPDGSRLTAVHVEQDGRQARLQLDPGLPALASLQNREVGLGRWHVTVDGHRLTGGTWRASRLGDEVALTMDVTERWRPRRLPWLMRVVTTVVPVFRRWPTTYRWQAVVRLGPAPTMTSAWTRTGDEDGQGYRRATGSSSAP